MKFSEVFFDRETRTVGHAWSSSVSAKTFPGLVIEFDEKTRSVSLVLNGAQVRVIPWTHVLWAEPLRDMPAPAAKIQPASDRAKAAALPDAGVSVPAKKAKTPTKPKPKRRAKRG